MVYCGKPSRGCENCRRHHKKCDERRPACSRCIKAKTTCLGYRNQADLMFRDESRQVQARVQQKRIHTSDSLRLRLRKKLPSHPFAEDLQTWKLPVVGRLSPPMEDAAICRFYYTTLDTLSSEDPVHYLHLQLPGLYAKCSPDSALRLATEAISYAASRHLLPQGDQLARKGYIKAVQAIREAVQDPAEAQNPTTLYAILLLSGYETMLWDLDTPLAWGTHLDGAAAVARLQVASDGNSVLLRNMVGFIRKSTVLGHMQLCRPIDDIFAMSNLTTTPQDNPEDTLFSTAAKLPDLQYRSSCVLAPSPATSESEVEALLHRARHIDQELSDWADTVRETWPYTVAMNMEQVPSLRYAPHELHRYPSFYVARVWNCYRVSRLIVQSIRLRTSSWLSSSGELSGLDCEIEDSKQQTRMLVNEICASVPFLLGHDLSKMKVPSTNTSDESVKGKEEEVEDKGRERTHTGRFSLIWPLRVACSSLSVPKAQKDWIRLQLQHLAKCGEAQAHFACLTESRILQGGSDSVLIDCV